MCSTYAGVCQRWLVVHSESRQKSDLKQLDKRIAQAKTKTIKALKELGAHHQKGKQTERPTLRWLLQCFQSVHLIGLEGRKWAIKLNDVQRHILRFLGSACQKYYFLC